ncbi:MAG: PorT family protein [Bernardetiaceae bacterium]|nr:PorT family protein [Bernardetiaceae bacterium]
MKKLLFFIAFFGVLCVTNSPNALKAQTSLSIGPKLGVSFTNLAGQDVENYESAMNNVDTKGRATFVGGIYGQLAFVGMFSLQPEILYHSKGAKETYFLGNTEVGSQTINLNYIEIPVLFKLRLPLSKKFLPNVFIGPYYATLLNANQTISGNSNNLMVINNFDANSSDFGGVIGGGFDIQAKNVFFTVDARYGIGFSEVVDGFSSRNNNLTLMTGIGFRLGK